VVIGAVFIVCAAALAVGLYFGLRSDDETQAETLNPPDPTSPPPPSNSELGIYWNAAVVTNGYPCAIIGRLVVRCFRNKV